MFVGKVRSLPLECTLQKSRTQVGSSLVNKYSIAEVTKRETNNLAYYDAEFNTAKGPLEQAPALPAKVKVIERDKHSSFLRCRMVKAPLE